MGISEFSLLLRPKAPPIIEPPVFVFASFEVYPNISIILFELSETKLLIPSELRM
jgi:hypothetical protein